MYKIRDISRGYGLSDETYESLEDANRAAIFRSAQTGSDVQVIHCPDLEDIRPNHESKFYEIWFNDGSRITFLEKEISEYARRFDFSEYDLIHKKEADLYDDEGDLIGGVQQI